MKLTNEEYDKLVKEASPKSPVIKDCLFAFLVGGSICLFGEILRQWYMSLGASGDNAKAFVSLTLIAITAILTGIGVFDKIAGLVVGEFTDCKDDPLMGCTLMESIRQVVEPYDFPVLFDYPSGHIDSNYPLLLGATYHMVVQ